MVDTLYNQTGSDDALTDFDLDGLAEIPIGRLPVRTGTEITQALTRFPILNKLSGRQLNRGSLCVSDSPNGFDFAALCSRIFNELPPSFPQTFINRDESNAPNNLLSNLNSGKYFVNYSGHGNVGVWSTGDFFTTAAASNLTNGNNLSVYTMLTCLNGYFLEPASASLSESLLSAQNGGAVAVWSSSSLTTPTYQEIMATTVLPSTWAWVILHRLGDLVNDSKTAINGGRDVRLSWVLLGDPTLKVR